MIQEWPVTFENLIGGVGSSQPERRSFRTLSFSKVKYFLMKIYKYVIRLYIPSELNMKILHNNYTKNKLKGKGVNENRQKNKS